MKRFVQYAGFALIIFIPWLNLSAQPTGSVSAKLEDQVRQYWFVMLTEGKHREQDSVTVEKIQAAHMANINQLYHSGKLKVAGPFGDNGQWRGIFIFDCATKAEVVQLLNTDPAIISGRLEYDIRPWWTAAIGSFKPGPPEQ